MLGPIGGYFEWEFPAAQNADLHKDSVCLNSGRHGLEYILRGLKTVQALWIPYFTCEVVLQPLEKLSIPYRFYRINSDLELAEEIALGKDEFLLYTNYYGIKDAYASRLAEKYGDKIIIDNAQALFYKASPAVHQFYSPRKFMGVPDGGLVITSLPNVAGTLPICDSNERCSHLLKRMEKVPSEGYGDFKANEEKITEMPLSQMSPITRTIFSTVDLDDIKSKRRKNFAALHGALSSTNLLRIPSLDSFECPLVYPYYTNNGSELKKKLIEQNIFVATYLPNVFEWCKPSDLEYNMADNIVCIPVDQRYGTKEMQRIVRVVLP